MVADLEPAASTVSDLDIDTDRLDVKVSRNAAYNIGGQAGVLILSLVSVQRVYASLGADAMALITFSVLLNAVLLTAMDAGIGNLTIREIAQSEGDTPYRVDFARCGAFIYWMLFAVIAVAVTLLSRLLVGNWLNLDSLDHGTAAAALAVIFVGSFLSLPQRFYAGVLKGMNRMDVTNAIDLSVLALQQVAIIVVVAFGGGLLAAAVAIAVTSVLGTAASIVAVGRELPMPALLPRFSPGIARRHARFAAQMSGISVLALAQTQADKLAVSIFLPASHFAVYALVSVLATRAGFIANATAEAALPSFAATADDPPASWRLFVSVHEFVCLVSVPVFAGIICFGRPLVLAVTDRPSADLITTTLIVMAVGSFLHCLAVVPFYLSIAIDEQAAFLRANVLACVLVTPPMIWAIWRWGVISGAIGWVAYHVLLLAFAVPLTTRTFPGPLRRTELRRIGTALAVGILLYLPASVVTARFDYALGVAVATWLGATGLFGLWVLPRLGADLRDLARARRSYATGAAR